MANVFNQAKEEFLKGTWDLVNDNMGCILLEAAPVSLDGDAGQDVATVAALLALTPWTELVENPSHALLAGKAVPAFDAANNRSRAQAQSTLFSAVASGGTITACIITRQAAAGRVDANDVPLAFYQLADTLTNDGDITIQWSSSTPTTADDYLRLA